MTATTADAAAVRAARRRRCVPYLLLLPGGLWLLLFYVVPMVQLASVSLQEGDVFAWKFGNYADALSAASSQFLRSMFYAGAATLVALIVAYPLAYAIAFKGGRYRNLFLVLILVPFLTPFLLRTLAWKIILADDGLVVNVLQFLRLVPQEGRVLATGTAVVAGLVYNFLPFMTLPIYVSLEKIDRTLIEGAADLYAGPFVAFRKVTWPLSLPGVVAGTLLTLIPAAGDYVNAQLLGSTNQYMIGNVIQSRFLVVLDYPSAAALSFTLMVAILVIIIPYVRAVGTEDLVT